eukprot:TRINITY_DN1583_c4_g1_i1.p1 TRINITY_DN1583_c4_g1~~TRINITY_DN1583_c4_g1_i1.p1  ORF type:complete len:596 (+),score=287.24 TRINITY_DN1583_c4_g1_i1:53-1840(+)
MPFADELWDQFDNAYKFIWTGKDFCKKLVTFLKLHSEIEKEYSKKLLNLHKTAPENETGTVNDAWGLVKQEIEILAKKHNDFGESILTTLHDPIFAWERDNQKERRKLKIDGTKLTKDTLAGEQRVNKSKAGYETARRALETVERSIKIDPKKLAAENKKVEQADSQYQASVSAMKDLEARFFDSEMPRILSDLENLEKTRRNIIKNAFDSYHSIYRMLTPDASNLEKLKSKITSIKPEIDITQFIEQNKTRKEKAPRTEYEPWNPVSKICCKEIPSTSQPSNNQSTTQTLSNSTNYNPSLQYQQSSTGTNTNLTRQSTFNNITNNSTYIPQSVSSNNNNNSHTIAPAQSSVQAPTLTSTSTPASLGKAKALYDYTATNPTELSFVRNDIINILGKDPSGWWQGELQNKYGLFPSNFVEEIVAPITASVPPPISRANRPAVSTYQSTQQSPPYISSTTANPNTNPNQLVSGMQSMSINPSVTNNYISTVTNNNSTNNINNTSSMYMSTNVNPNYTNQSTNINQSNYASTLVTTNNPVKYCRALYQYNAENDAEVTIKVGDVLSIDKLDDDGWYRGMNLTTGKQGRFPSNFVTVLQ